MSQVIETPVPDDVSLNVVDELLERIGRERHCLIPLLQAVQEEFGYLPSEALKHICRSSEITPSQITGVSTFYSQFRHTKAGRYEIDVCHGTACHVAGAERITAGLCRHLGIPEGSDTSPDGLFSIRRVACVGTCSLAPVMLIDGETYGRMDLAKATQAVDSYPAHAVSRARQSEGDRDARNNEAPPGSGKPPATEIRISLGSCCIARGSLHVHEAFEREARRTGRSVQVKHVGCAGLCQVGPLVEIASSDGVSSIYGNNGPEAATSIIRRHLPPVGLIRKAGWAVRDLRSHFSRTNGAKKRSYPQLDSDAKAKFVDRQVRITTEGTSVMDPRRLDEYLRFGGYKALERVIGDFQPDELISLIEEAQLRGRGGAGYPTARKWRDTRKSQGERKFVVCNGDEGDPGAFMDRMLLEACPHRVLEGLILSGYAVGASEGFFYIRSEYALAVRRIEQAIAQAEERGFLGENIFGSDFSFRVKLMRGAHAFVCGEETALIASLEGERGMPVLRPPYPSESGLWGHPTCVNNVETLGTIPWIVRNGAKPFAAIGTVTSKGTKTFALAGQVARSGLIEVPMGTTIREVVEVMGGGVAEGRTLKAVQIGGPSGGCVPAHLADTPIDYEALSSVGATMGSGGLVVLDNTTCMVDLARFFLHFTQSESCGRCTFCRIGTKRMLEILDRLCEGKGKKRDLDHLELLAQQTTRASLCGLGKTAPNPVLSTLRYFRHEYEAHLRGECPARKCEELISYRIDETCIGCTVCAQVCPVQAIPLEPYRKHVIDDAICTRCDLCRTNCPVDAIVVLSPRGGTP